MKERIIGAAVLVIFVVLVVPIFLDGPPVEGEIVSERVLLPGQEDQETKTVVLDRERSAPIPATDVAKAPTDTRSTDNGDDAKERVPQPLQTVSRESSSESQSAAQPAAAKPVAEVARAEDKSPTPVSASSTPQDTSSTGMWAVQLGSFSNKENAENLAANLRKQGYAAFLSQLQTGSGPLHRVRIGPQKDRESAEAMAARLLKVDHKGQVVPHP